MSANEGFVIAAVAFIVFVLPSMLVGLMIWKNRHSQKNDP